MKAMSLRKRGRSLLFVILVAVASTGGISSLQTFKEVTNVLNHAAVLARYRRMA